MKKATTILILISIIFITSCAELLQILSQASIQQPTVKLRETKLTGWSFEGVELNFSLAVDNPNPVGIHLAGFDYELILADQSFITGNQNEGVDIAANGQRQVEIPVQLTFRKIYDTFSALKNADSLNYQLKTGFSFDLPVLGAVRIPVQTSGALPNLRLPSLEIKGLKLNTLNLSGADLDLKLTINNPNALKLLVNSLDYNVAVGGRSWLKGKTSKLVQITGKGESTLTLPVKLSFSEMGTSIYQVLSGSNSLEYSFDGLADVGADNPIFKPVKLPLNTAGSVRITK